MHAMGQANNNQEYSQRHGTIVKLVTIQFCHNIILARVIMSESIISFAERLCHRVGLSIGKTTVHSRTLDSGFSCRKSPLGRPMLKQHVARARWGDRRASCTSSSGGEPIDARIVGRSAAILVPLLKLAFKASGRVSNTQEMRTEHVPNLKLAGSLPLQTFEACPNLGSSGGPTVRLKAWAGRTSSETIAAYSCQKMPSD